MLKNVVHGLLELLAPRSCSACTAPLDIPEGPFCSACHPLAEPWADEKHDFRAVFHYGGPVADAIHRLKYEGQSEIATAFAVHLRAAAALLPTSIEGVIPVPLTAAKLRQRGYNQSALLARQVARALGTPMQPLLLTRVRSVARQVGHNRAERLKQVEGAFLASPRVRERELLLVDDVRTTGATLAAARQALLAQGARRVHALVLACADDARASGAL